MSVAQSASVEDRVVFSCGDRDYTVRDLIDWSAFRGELEPLWDEVLRVEAKKAAHAQALEPDYDALEKQSIAFRYAHDLITAEETERWLEDRHLTLRHFSEYFARHYWSNASAGQVRVAEIAYGAAPTELRELLIAELTFSGELDRMATRLSRRLAGQNSPKTEAVAPALIAAERERFLQRTGASEAGLSEWLERHRRDSQWLEELLTLEAAHRRSCEELFIGNARERELSLLRMPLTRFETQVIEVESRDAAQEAIFCVRNDNMSLEEVAAEGRYPYREKSLLLEDIDPGWQQKFLSVSMGEMLEPIVQGDGFQVCRVVSKTEPSLDDSTVRTRVDQRILERHFADLVTKHIDWRIPLAFPS